MRARWVVRARNAAALVGVMIVVTGQSVGPQPVVERVTPVSGLNFLDRDTIVSQFEPGGKFAGASSFLCQAGTYTNVTGACDPTVPSRVLAVMTQTVTLTPLGGVGVTSVLDINSTTMATSRSNTIVTENIGLTSCVLTCNSATNATLVCTNAVLTTCTETMTLQ